MIDITTHTKAVLAWCFPPNASRPHIMEGILFDAGGLQIATNGHGLAMLAQEHVTPTDYPVINGMTATDTDAPTVLQRDDVAGVVKALPKRSTLPYSRHALELGTRNGTITLGVAAKQQSVTVTPREATDFPDYRQIIPPARKGSRHVGVDPAYLKAIGESMLAIGATCVEMEIPADPIAPLRFIGEKDGAALVIVLMPMRL